MKDIGTCNTNESENIAGDGSLTVFIPEPPAQRLLTMPRDGDTEEEIAKRQAYLDLVTLSDHGLAPGVKVPPGQDPAQ